jgi:hypothetical protein
MQSLFDGLLEDGGLCILAKNYDRSSNGSSARGRRIMAFSTFWPTLAPPSDETW